ncbi:MAG: hypothetical protein SO016_06835 [Lachnospiraceae bacterium]|nr:hypothetical protein [Lachnospiraceae bacterium]
MGSAEKGNTKQEILEAVLNLFSVQGFETTSIAQIAGLRPGTGRCDDCKSMKEQFESVFYLQ